MRFDSPLDNVEDIQQGRREHARGRGHLRTELNLWRLTGAAWQAAMSRAGRPAGRGLGSERERRVGRVADAQTPRPEAPPGCGDGVRPCPQGSSEQ